MKAKKIVRVELKNPVLRRIRKGFRDIIELAVKQEVSRLYAIFREYKEKRLKAKDPIEKEVLDRKGVKFMDRGRMLMGLLSKSIIRCKSGGGCASYIEATGHGLHPENSPSNLDMVWIPFHGAWFCTKCCENLIEGDKILRKEKHPDYIHLLKERGFL